MTGLSGFVGSALAAKLVQDPEVDVLLSLTSGDADGSRARTALADALDNLSIADTAREVKQDAGLGDQIAGDAAVEKQQDVRLGNPSGGVASSHEQREAWLGKIQPVLCADLQDEAELRRAISDLEVDEVWHVAAHMSYDPGELATAVRFNAVASTQLLTGLKRCERFYFISTTGVAGPGRPETAGELVPEELLVRFDTANPYTASKILAEYMLWWSAERHGVPLTILRPGSVIGDSRTGWAGKTRYGYYSYLHVLKKFLKKDLTFFLDIDPDKRFPVIHIDHFADMCQNLRATGGADSREIFHAINRELWTAEEHFALFEEVAGGAMRIAYGPGEAGFNKVFNEMNRDNNRFMGTTWLFAEERLQTRLGDALMPPSLSKESLSAVFRGYLNSNVKKGSVS
jgi:nucleoside-diphosphate-sugar epimerase